MTVLDTPALPLVVLVPRDGDVSRTGWLRAHLDDALRVRPDRVVVDLSQTSTLDSAALQVLLEAHRQLARRGGVLALRGLSPRLVRLVGLCGLTDVLHVEDACAG